MKRADRPILYRAGEPVLVLGQYERRLHIEDDLVAATIRDYLSDLRHFALWYGSTWKQGRKEEQDLQQAAGHTAWT